MNYSEKKSDSSFKKTLDNKRDEKEKNPFLNQSKKKENNFYPERKNLKSDVERNNVFISKNSQEKKNKESFQNNMFEKGLNKHKLNIDNEEMFPSLSEDIVVKKSSNKKDKNILNYKEFTEKTSSGVLVNKKKEEDFRPGWLYMSRKLEMQENGKMAYVTMKQYNESEFYKENDENSDFEVFINFNDDFNKWNENRIERIKCTFEYDYLWDEDKRNEMLYGLYKEDLVKHGDVYDDYDEDQEDEEFGDFYSYKKKYNDDLN